MGIWVYELRGTPKASEIVCLEIVNSWPLIQEVK